MTASHSVSGSTDSSPSSSSCLVFHSPSTDIVGTPYGQGQPPFQYPFPAPDSVPVTPASTSSSVSLYPPLTTLNQSPGRRNLSHIRLSKSSSELPDVLYHSPPLASSVDLGRSVPALIHPKMRIAHKDPPMPPSLREKISKRSSVGNSSPAHVGLGIQSIPSPVRDALANHSCS